MPIALFKRASLVVLVAIINVIRAQVPVIAHVVHFVFIPVVYEPCAVAKEPLDVLARFSRSLLHISNPMHLLELKHALQLHFTHMVEITLVSHKEQDHILRALCPYFAQPIS